MFSKAIELALAASSGKAVCSETQRRKTLQARTTVPRKSSISIRTSRRKALNEIAPSPSVPWTSLAWSSPQIATSSLRSYAIRDGTGNLVCWGSNTAAQLCAPPEVSGAQGTVRFIDAGGLYACAIQSGSFELVYQGSDGFGRAAPPADVDGTTSIAWAIAAGSQHNLAIE